MNEPEAVDMMGGAKDREDECRAVSSTASGPLCDGDGRPRVFPRRRFHDHRPPIRPRPGHFDQIEDAHDPAMHELRGRVRFTSEAGDDLGGAHARREQQLQRDLGTRGPGSAPSKLSPIPPAPSRSRKTVFCRREHPPEGNWKKRLAAGLDRASVLDRQAAGPPCRAETTPPPLAPQSGGEPASTLGVAAGDRRCCYAPGRARRRYARCDLRLAFRAIRSSTAPRALERGGRFHHGRSSSPTPSAPAAGSGARKLKRAWDESPSVQICPAVLLDEPPLHMYRPRPRPRASDFPVAPRGSTARKILMRFVFRHAAPVVGDGDDGRRPSPRAMAMPRYALSAPVLLRVHQQVRQDLPHPLRVDIERRDLSVDRDERGVVRGARRKSATRPAMSVGAT